VWQQKKEKEQHLHLCSVAFHNEEGLRRIYCDVKELMWFSCDVYQRSVVSANIMLEGQEDGCVLSVVGSVRLR
jgi:hypothetical protein